MVIGRTCLSTPAILSSFHRFKVKNEVFPAILPQIESQVHGLLLTDIQDNEFVALDKFEEGYTRMKVKIKLDSASNEFIESFTYVWNEDNSLLYDTWDYEKDFLQNMQSFIDLNQRFKSIL